MQLNSSMLILGRGVLRPVRTAVGGGGRGGWSKVSINSIDLLLRIVTRS